MRHLSVTADAVPLPLQGRLPLRGKPARLAAPSGAGNRFAATVRLSAKLTERCLGSIKKKPLCQRRGTPFITLPMYPAE